MKWLARVLKRNLHIRLLAIGALPLLLITSLLTTLNIYNRQADLSETLNLSGQHMVDHLSRTTDFALYTNNQPLLINIVRSIEQMPNILGVAFLDSRREQLLLSASFPGSQTSDLSLPLEGGSASYQDFLLFERPVYATQLEIHDYSVDEPLNLEEDILGWVVVAVDLVEGRNLRRNIILTSSSIAAAILGAAFLLAIVLSRSVLSPIRKLTHTVNLLERGELKTRAQVTTDDELAVLATGVNHLAASVSRSQYHLQEQVRSATRGLNQALEDLKVKNTALQQARDEALQASQTAEEANQAKGDFLARMSHELRTPLNSIQGFVRLLEQSSLEANDKHYCQIIDRAASQLLMMINDILEFTKLQSDTQTIVNEPFHLFECIEQAVHLLAPGAHDKGIELYCDFSSEVPERMIGDEMRIRQIVVNLVGNAIKFTDTGYVSVLVSLSLQESGPHHLIIEVSDTGIGIDPQKVEHIFDAFVQADTSIARRFGGTGLGLPIVKAYTSLMQGNISVTANGEKGTRCRVVLPMNQPLPGSLPPKLSYLVLLFDSDASSRRANSHLLERIVSRQLICSNFDELVDALAANTPSGILFSWSLSESSGQQMTTLEYLLDNQNCPVMIQAPLHILRDQFQSGALGKHPRATFSAKPAALSELRKTIDNFEQKSEENSEGSDLSGLNILVAEDNDFSRLLLCTLLKRTGCHFDEATNGREAIVACQRNAYDVLMLDLHMPEVTGLEVIHELWQTDNLNRDTPIVVLTADVLIDVHRELGDLSVEAVINKPFDEQHLLETLFELSGRSGAQAHQLQGGLDSIPKQQYFDALNRLLDELNVAFNSQNIEAMREVSHQLSGIVAVYHLADLEKQVQVLHSLIRLGDLRQAEIAIDSLRIQIMKQEKQDNPAFLP